MAVLNGNDILVYVDGTKVAYSTSCSLEMTGPGTIPTTNKDTTGWVTKLKSVGAEWSISVDGLVELLYTASHEPLNFHTLLAANSTVLLRFIGGSNNSYFSGYAVVTSFSMNAGLNEVATYSASFEGLGTLRFNESIT